jgi:hypothetical protein
VIANTSPWDLLNLLPPGAVPDRWRRQQQATPACASFLHWHLGLKGGAELADLPIHHVWVGDWQRGINAERNVAVLSAPGVARLHAGQRTLGALARSGAGKPGL